MSVTTKELTDHARFMRNAEPQVFDGFYRAFEKYTELVVLALVNTTGEDLLRAQGRAQQCMKILGVLQEVKNGH